MLFLDLHRDVQFVGTTRVCWVGPNAGMCIANGCAADPGCPCLEVQRHTELATKVELYREFRTGHYAEMPMAAENIHLFLGLKHYQFWIGGNFSSFCT